MDLKKILIYLLPFFILIFVLIFWINKPNIRNIDSKGVNIIAFGDSLVYGIGASKKGENDMFSIVAKDLNVEIINKGVPGDTTIDGLERLDRDVLSQNPRIVFVLLGGNDYLQKIPKEKTFANLRTIVEKIQDSGAAVVLMGIRGGLLDHFEKDFKDLSKDLKTAYISNVLEGIILNRSLMSDSVHPNDKGYKIISTRISPVLEMMLNN